MNDKKKKVFIVVGISILLVLLDQWTKELAIEHLMMSPPMYYFDGLFQLVYAENPGAFLGMGGDWSRLTRFIVFGLIVTGGLGYLFWVMITHMVTKVEMIAYSCILAGGVGNVIDRLFRAKGHVVDFMFIDLKFHPMARTGVFNVADVAIVIGVLLLLFFMNNSKKEKSS